MLSSGMLSRVDLVTSDVSEEGITSVIRVTIIGEVGATLAVTSNGPRHLVFLPSVLRLLVNVKVFLDH
jgi:hypothetical protein